MKKVLVETSARHIHLTQADLETLFGKDYQLTPKKELSQPGQFACVERVDVVGPKKTLSGVSILGPVRKATQVELSLTHASDDLFQYAGVEVDDITGPGGQGTTSFESDGNVFDGWAVSGPPAGSPPNPNDWIVGSSRPNRAWMSSAWSGTSATKSARQYHWSPRG